MQIAWVRIAVGDQIMQIDFPRETFIIIIIIIIIIIMIIIII